MTPFEGPKGSVLASRIRNDTRFVGVANRASNSRTNPGSLVQFPSLPPVPKCTMNIDGSPGGELLVTKSPGGVAGTFAISCTPGYALLRSVLSGKASGS